MEKKVAIVAAGITQWGARQATYRDLISEAGKATFESNKNISKDEIKSFVLSTVYPERSAVQSHPAPLAAECLGVYPREFHARVENMCGSGNTAIRVASMAIMSGMAEMVLVIGAEKMLLPKEVFGEIFINASTGIDREWEGCFGLTPPGLFAMCAQQHMSKYGTTEEQMAMVAVKNHNHSMNNPIAHHQRGTTLEKVMASRPISMPMKLFDCSTNTDGAAGVILASAERAKDLTDNPVWLLGQAQISDGYPWARMHKDWSEWPALKACGEMAYQMAGITADDVDLAEVHDCFTISEIIEYEELGFCKKGEGGKFVEEGQSDHGGKVVVNPRGGLIACGHPLGATGVGQAYEMYLQLRGEAGKRQVKDAKIGLSQQLSGLGESHIILYGRD